jgi:glycosyltransferase involved in cell wall biosynthesis
MKDVPLVSIVLPTYNGSRYLAQSIQSCIDQTYQKWELIVVDDCSTDDTPAIIERFMHQDPRITSVRNENNRRLPRSLNHGFSLSKGEYLTWTSDDNLYEPDALELMVRYLEGEPATGVVYCNERYIGPEGEELRINHKEGPEALREKNVVHACFLYRRRVYEAVGDYDPEMVLVEDYEYWLRVSKQFPIAYLRGVAPYRYRWHPDSLSCTRTGAVMVQKIRAQARHLVPPPERLRFMTEALWSALWLFRRDGDLKAAWCCALECWRLAPWRFRHLKALLGTGLRYLTSGPRHNVAYLSGKPKGKALVSLTTPSEPGKT